MINHIGKSVKEFIKLAPFSCWTVEISEENELEEKIIHYIFPENGLELRCNESNEILAVFIYVKEYGGFPQCNIDIILDLNREEVKKLYGEACKSGEKKSHPILGEINAWDRFLHSDHAIHFEYSGDGNTIDKITYMHKDIIPD